MKILALILRMSVMVMLITCLAPNGQAQPAMTEFFVGTPPNQMYVQHWRASSAKPLRPAPVIMVHGGVHTGTVWTTTPDGQPGWAYRFTEEGWNVYVVDWPGVGRSGVWPESLSMGPQTVEDALILLLERIGPSVLIGHSIGAGFPIKLAERRPELARAIVALGPVSVEIPNPNVPVAELGKPVSVPREAALQRFANSTLFPRPSFDNYFCSLVTYSPRIRNAAVGATDEFKIDRAKVNLWKKVPVLFLAAEEDRTLPRALSEETARVMGVPHTMLGHDWGLPGHGHLFIVEKGNEQIARGVLDWLSKTVR